MGEGANTLSSRMILWLTTFSNATQAVSRQVKEDNEPMTFLNPAKMALLAKAEAALFGPDANVGHMTALTAENMADDVLTTEVLAGMSNNVFLAPMRALALLYMCNENVSLTDIKKWRLFDMLMWGAMINHELNMVGCNKVFRNYSWAHDLHVYQGGVLGYDFREENWPPSASSG